MIFKNIACSLFSFIFFAASAQAQSKVDFLDGYVTVAATRAYQKSIFYQWIFGKNWRKEWSTPVTVPVVLLDTVYGGLIPYEKAGGGESKSLRLKSAQGKEYVLRSINKDRSGSVPKFLKNTWYQSLVQDGVSMSHPYGAIAVPEMLQQANIYHTRPRLVYIPTQPALDSFNNTYANNLYLLEERPAGDWNGAPHLGGFKSYQGTMEVKEKMRDDNTYQADQHAFVKARLFDILISDVDRHEGNWKWGLADTGPQIFKPVPVDRDQAFFSYSGLLTRSSIVLTRRRFMQNFNYNIKNVKKLTLTKQDRKLDKFFTNQMNFGDWINAAANLKRLLTDSVIAKSIQQLPREIFLLSGTEIIEKLKSRRDNLETYAAQYYNEMAKEVDVNGSSQKEYFEIRKVGNNQAAVKVYRLNTKGQKEAAPYYHRVFNHRETKNITLHGFGGDDVFALDKSIKKIRIIVIPFSKKDKL